MEGLLLPLLLVPFGLVVAAVLGAIAFTKVKQLELRVGFRTAVAAARHARID